MIKLSIEQLKKILETGSYVSVEDLSKPREKVMINTYIDELLSGEYVSKNLLGQAIADYYKIDYLDLSAIEPNRDLVLKLPEEISKKYNVLLVKEDKKSIIFTTDNPEQPGLMNELEKQFKDKKIVLNFSLTENIESLFIYYLKPLKTRFEKIIESKKRVAPEIFDEILIDAIAYKVSDIHIEPHSNEIIVRFRVDGVLHESGRIPKEYYENILNRVKIQAKLRIDEHFSPQDGAIQYLIGDHTIAMRVSIVPTLDGEKIVIRILSEYVKSFSLEDLGLFHNDQQALIESAHKPFGMILVTGPTGSGKTTTLYALLNLINNPSLNITTIEDPVEYKMLSINQIQVDLKTNLTFANGLRSILRQDPDIVLVGEIRDKETAEISVNAALTGHLMFSTFHANDAATAIPRLLDIGVEPFLIASTIELIISQRLVRRICSFCKVSKDIDKVELNKTFPNFEKYFNKETTIYEGKGCEHCRGTKYLGRIGIFESIRMTKEMKDLILKNPSSKQIWELAKSQGGRILFEDGIEKVKNGMTTIEELLRVAPEPI
jgi:type II secretory ATPase GspE/PulE/Tfp pilus assembly ATPase PilB-like protein